ncbi:hypothetical protein Tco_0762571 [Tanacetum coccineum]
MVLRIVKEQVSKDTSSFVESSLNVDKETVFLVDKKIEFVKPKNHEKSVKKSVRYAEMYRSQSPRGNQRNWNGQKSNQLGSDFVMYNKACFICGSFDHVQAHCKYHPRERMVYGNNYNRVNYNYTTNRTHPNAQRNMVPRAVLMKTGLKSFNTARTVNTAHPKSTVFSVKPMSHFLKSPQSTIKRPYQSKTVLTNKKFTQKYNTAKAKAVNTARPKAVNTARPHSAVVNAVRVNQENVVKALACWVWRPTKLDSASITLKKHNYIDARGRSKSISRNLMKVMLHLREEHMVVEFLQVEDGSHNESDEKDKSKDDSSPKEVNAAGQHVNTASPEVNTGSFKLNNVDLSVNIASSYELDSPKDMFKLGASHTLETTHVEFFSDEDELEVNLGNITNSYTVPTTPNTRIHKDHPIKNVTGDVKSTIPKRRMTKSTSEQGFLSAVYEQKTHDALNTCLYACFLSQIEPTSIAKALSDSSWMEAMREELLQFKL